MASVEQPKSIEAEVGVLGSILIDPERCVELCLDARITPEWFTGSSSRNIYQCMHHLSSRHKPIELLSICDSLGSGYMENLEALQDGTPSAAHCEYYIEVLREKFELRNVLKHAESVSNAVLSGGGANEVISMAQSSAFALSEIGVDTTEVDKAVAVERLVSQWKDAESGTVVGIPFPWPDLTERTGGLRRGSCCPFIGRDGQGKSTVLGKMAKFWGEQGIAGLIFPFEDGADRYIARIAGCGVWSNFEADTGKFADTTQDILDEKWEVMNRTMADVVKMPLYFEDGFMTPEELCARIRKHKRAHDIQWVMVDNFKDIKFDYSNGVTSGETQAAQALQVCAKELQIGIIVSSHLRDVEDGQWLSRRMVKGSKDQFKGARQVILLQNAGFPEAICQKYFVTPNTKMLQMDKNTFGAAGLVGVVLEPVWNLQDWVPAGLN